MKVHYIYCHPMAESFHGAIRDEALAGLRTAGHDVDLLDLYAEGFDPLLRETDRRHYHDTSRNRQGLEPLLGRLAAADALVVQFPTWSFGPPAMLKGYFDRVLMPGVAFDLTDPKRVRPLLPHIRKIGGIVTYGRPRHVAWWMGDPPRKLVTRYLRWFTSGAETEYHALYHMNVATEAKRLGFLAGVKSAMVSF